MVISNPESGKKPDGVTLVVLAGLFSLFIVASTCYAIFSNYHPIPIQDHWLTIDYYWTFLEGKLDFRALWALDNEHRILFPRLLYLLDYRLANGTGYFLIFLILLLQGCHACLVSSSLWRLPAFTRDEKRYFACIAIMLFFWLTQRTNFIWNHQVCFILNGFAASLAAFLICRVKQVQGGRGWAGVFSAAVCCVIAAYSLANGLFMWGVLLPVIWKSRLPVRYVLFWIFFGLLLSASYLAGYHSPSHHSSLLQSFHFKAFHYLLVYLGNPVSNFNLAAGTLLGAAGLFSFCFFTWRFLKENEPGFFRKFAFAESAYVLGKALATAIGRNNFPVGEITSSRYHTPILVFWFFQIVLIYAGLRKRVRLPGWARAGLLAAAFLVVLPVQILAAMRLKVYYLNLDQGALALMAGVRDDTAFQFLWLADSLIFERDRFLREHRFSVYREPWPLALGRNMRDDFRVDSAAFRAKLDEIRAVGKGSRSGYFVRGEILTEGGTWAPEVVLLTHEDTVVGFAKTRKRPCRGCFSGYVRGLENRDFDLFALDEKAGRVRKIELSGVP